MRAVAPRVMREIAKDQGVLAHLSDADLRRREAILNVATEAMARSGIQAVTLAGIAHALRTTVAAIRRIFSDSDEIAFTIMRDHMNAIMRAIGACAPMSAPNRAEEARGAYYREARTATGALRPAHRILVRDAEFLPEPLAEHIADLRNSLAALLHRDAAVGQVAMSLLDNPWLGPINCAVMLKALLDDAAAHAAEPPAPTKPAPEPEPEPPAAPPRALTFRGALPDRPPIPGRDFFPGDEDEDPDLPFPPPRPGTPPWTHPGA